MKKLEESILKEENNIRQMIEKPKKIGRIAYEDPFILTGVDQFYEGGMVNNILRREIIEGLIDYMGRMGKDDRLAYQALRNTLGLFHNKRGSKIWRQLLTPPWAEGYGAKEILEKTLRQISRQVLDERPSIFN